MAQRRSTRIVLLVLILLIPVAGVVLGNRYGRSTTTASPIHTVLADYFGNGYVPYALPGQGAVYEPGAIIRYRKKAEVLVRPRAECFDLALAKTQLTAPTVKWTAQTETSAGLGLLIPPAAALDISASMKRAGTETVSLQFGALDAVQIPTGTVADWQIDPRFPVKCAREFGKDNILVLGTVGSMFVRYQLSSRVALDAALTASTNLDIGSKTKVAGSSTGENVLEIRSGTVTVLGYLPFELTREGLSGRGAEDGRLVLRPLSVAEALQRRTASDE